MENPRSLCFFPLAQKRFPDSFDSDAECWPAKSLTLHTRPSAAGQHRSPSAEFLPSLQAQYRHGLALCQEAAEVRDAAFPEADPFQVAAALFQTKLMSFYRQVERRQAERELLRELSRFSSKVGAWAFLPQDPVPPGQP